MDRAYEIGGTIVGPSTTATGRWRKLVALSDCTLAAGTVAEDLDGTLDGLQLKATVELVATFTSIQLTTGNAVAYK